ncbi:MAG TPA: hypothetical protein VF912_12305 [Anaeromyxobacter sp.]
MRSMPISVVAVAVLVVAFLVEIIAIRVAGGQSVSSAAPVVLFYGLILAGIASRHRLAWQWGRMIGLFFGGLLALAAVATPFRFGRWELAIPFAVASAQALAVGLLLGRPAAREWFRLTCPSCGEGRPRAADFLFRSARCRGCQHVW